MFSKDNAAIPSETRQFHRAPSCRQRRQPHTERNKVNMKKLRFGYQVTRCNAPGCNAKTDKPNRFLQGWREKGKLILQTVCAGCDREMGIKNLIRVGYTLDEAHRINEELVDDQRKLNGVKHKGGRNAKNK